MKRQKKSENKTGKAEKTLIGYYIKKDYIMCLKLSE